MEGAGQDEIMNRISRKYQRNVNLISDLLRRAQQDGNAGRSHIVAYQSIDKSIDNSSTWPPFWPSIHQNCIFWKLEIIIEMIEIRFQLQRCQIN